MYQTNDPDDIDVYLHLVVTPEDEERLDRLCKGLNKTQGTVVSAALYFLEQSLLYNPNDDEIKNYGKGE